MIYLTDYSSKLFALPHSFSFVVKGSIYRFTLSTDIVKTLRTSCFSILKIRNLLVIKIEFFFCPTFIFTFFYTSSPSSFLSHFLPFFLPPFLLSFLYSSRSLFLPFSIFQVFPLYYPSFFLPSFLCFFLPFFVCFFVYISGSDVSKVYWVLI